MTYYYRYLTWWLFDGDWWTRPDVRAIWENLSTNGVTLGYERRLQEIREEVEAEGRAACVSGKELDDNPHPENSPRHEFWKQGWHRGNHSDVSPYTSTFGRLAEKEKEERERKHSKARNPFAAPVTGSAAGITIGSLL